MTSMSKRQRIALVVHGHFYQPPRENPWTDDVPREPTAAPFPNWNARIHAECYRANAYARIYGTHGLVGAIVNNYAHISFDLGPTLARWIERHDGHVMRRMREGDAAQLGRLSSGGAMAQVWGHPITPLLSEQDLRTQILWGQYDFQRRFGYQAKGIWLPETAANPVSLAALIDAGIAYTILAPEQVEAVRAPDGDWEAVTTESVDTGRAYRFSHPDGSGRSIAIAIFDGPLSRDLAFGTATRDAASFLEAMRRSAERSKVADGPLVLAASDGELYGHHKKFADLALAYAVSVAAPTEGIDVTNLGAYLAKNPPTWELRLRPGVDGRGTAWSCSHGLGRWMRDCGCRMSDAKGSSQAWRGPLRKALDLLRDRSKPFFEDMALDLFADPWAARNAYGIVADDDPEARKRKLRSMGRPALRGDRGKLSTRALVLMEMQRSLLLMYASCAWFFDDIAGAEAAIALRRAAHAMDLWSALGGRPPTKAVLDVLADARSNDRKLGSGADAYVRASKDRVTAERAVARSVFFSLASVASLENQVPGFTVTVQGASALAAPKSLQGKATVLDRRNGVQTILEFSASHDGKAGFQCQVGKQRMSLDDLDEEAAQALRLGAIVRMATDCEEAAGCKSLIQVADQLATCTSSEKVALAGLLARALATFLEARFGGKNAVPRTDWQVAMELAERAGAMQPTDDWRRVQEVVWEHMALLRKKGKALPKALRALAERLQLLKSEGDEGQPTGQPTEQTTGQTTSPG
jgi:alpha-amylase/alpha-mannosidase (GH57 family)